MLNFGFRNDLFAGKSVVITGAGRGIGLAIAKAMVACGAHVIAHSGRSGSAHNLEGIVDTALEADFGDSASVSEFVMQVGKAAPVIDVLINNAGTMMGRFPADEITMEQYNQLVALNQTAVVQITNGLIPNLAAAGEASVINTVSISARTGGSPGSSIYSATKAFVSTYTKALARELAPKGIRANAVSPGTILTDFHDRYSSAEKLENTRRSIPLQRLGTADDCVSAYLFLASGHMSGYITGQTIEINGGQLIV